MRQNIVIFRIKCTILSYNNNDSSNNKYVNPAQEITNRPMQKWEEVIINPSYHSGNYIYQPLNIHTSASCTLTACVTYDSQNKQQQRHNRVVFIIEK